MHPEQLYQHKKSKRGSRTMKAGLQKLDSLLAVFRVLTQPFDLRDLLQHMNAEILVQFPRRLRSREELAGYLKSGGLAKNPNS